MPDDQAESVTTLWHDPGLGPFHEGQSFARAGDFSSALAKFEEALKISRALLPELEPDYVDWIRYVEGTIAYLNGDVETLQAKALEVKMNSEVLARLVKGLKKFGFPDYSRDY